MVVISADSFTLSGIIQYLMALLITEEHLVIYCAAKADGLEKSMYT